MSDVKQVIIMRKDLKNTKGEKVRSGKIIAQGCHASMKVFFDRMERVEDDWRSIQLTYEMQVWMDGIFTKVCLQVGSEEELVEIYNKAKEAELPCALIEDSGLTEFGGVKTKTCMAIGPANSEDIDKISGHLKLF